MKRNVSNATTEVIHLFANDANMGEATRSPTMNADDKTPSWKLLKLKSPLQTTKYHKDNENQEIKKKNAV